MCICVYRWFWSCIRACHHDLTENYQEIQHFLERSSTKTDSQTKRSRKAARRLVVFQLTKTHSTRSSRRFLNHSYQIKTIWFNCGYKIYHVTMSEAYRGNKRRKLHPYYPKQLLPLATSRKKKK